MPESDGLDQPAHVDNVLIEEELKTSYLSYAMSVIVKRALPDSRDGLKPSQRRILLAMNDLNQPRAGFRKCAKINGDTSGNYHPHGETVVYPTLVRLGQWWNLRYPLILPQGNFGSLDGDNPAAARYTEANLDRPAVEMLENLRDNTVPYIPNYDQTREEPTVLPSKFPNLLCNGASGIAVGMATEMPPHNFSEIADALLALLDDSDITTGDLLKHVKGPDFPNGGIVLAGDGMREAYETGRGQIKLRARCEIDECDERKGCEMIVVTEFPFQVSKIAIINKIKELAESGRIKGISDLDDQTGRQHPRGRLVIRVKRGENGRVILNRLYKFSQLQKTYSYNMIALVPPHMDIHSLEPRQSEQAERNLPQHLGLKRQLEIFRDHRYVVIRRRTYKALTEARFRRHILQGLLTALDRIDEIIKLIRGSSSVEVARIGLMTDFGFSQPQADHILEMPLRRLTGLESQRIEDELKEKETQIADFADILDKPDRVYDIIREEIADMRKRYGDERRTEIQLGGADGELTRAMMERDEEVVVTITNTGYMKRVALTAFRKQHRGGKGVYGGDTRSDDEEIVEHLFTTSTHNKLLIFTDLGRMFLLPVWNVPEASRIAKGRYIANIEGIEMRTEEGIASVYQVRALSAEDDRNVVMATRQGFIKKTALKDFINVSRKGIKAIKLRKDDALVGVRVTAGDQDILLGTRNGFSIRFPTLTTEVPALDEDGEPVLDDNGKPRSKTLQGVRPMGRDTQGVIGIKLRGGDEVIDMIVVERGTEKADVLTVCENGYGKRTPINEYRRQSRGGKGVINIRATTRNGKVVALKDVIPGDQLLLISTGGKAQRLAADDVRETKTRAAQGVRIQRLAKGEQIAAVTRVPKQAADRGTLIVEGDDNDNGNGDNGNGRDDGGEGDDASGTLAGGRGGGGGPPGTSAGGNGPGSAGRHSSRRRPAQEKPLTDEELLAKLDADLNSVDKTFADYERRHSRRTPPVEDEDVDPPESEPGT